VHEIDQQKLCIDTTKPNRLNKKKNKLCISEKLAFTEEKKKIVYQLNLYIYYKSLFTLE